MKSFYKFLSSRQEYGETLDASRKPVFRSSAIFPIIRNDYYKSSILFLGYWLIKRNISEINLLMTLRNHDGKIIKRTSLLIDSPKSYCIEIDSFLKNTIYENSDFTGSIELEIFSTRDMVFPYPAFVLNYYGQNFNTCVHTLGRIYNDFEDQRENESFKVPESGFDINASKDFDPFLSFVNGPEENSNPEIKYSVTNLNSEKLIGSFNLNSIKPYETVFIKIKDKIPDLETFLQNNTGSISLEHNFRGFFPRFLAGNIQKSFPSLSFTHTYYDCSSCSATSDYWNRSNEQFHDCSVYVPIFINKNEYTELVIYPNISPSVFDIHITLHDSNGKELHKLTSFLHVYSTDSKLMKIDFKEIISNLKLDVSSVKSAHLISEFKDKIPSRQKFGLNVGLKNCVSNLPCNICFNSKVGNPFLENKPGSFHWCPLFNDDHSVISIGNFSPKKNYNKAANITLKFYNHLQSIIEKKIILEPFGEFRLYSSDLLLENFFQNEPIWVTIEADNPNIQGFYFNFHKSGSVAGDHFF